MEKTVYYMFFCLYVAIATTTCFMLSIKPFLKMRKGKRFGWLMLAVTLMIGANLFWLWMLHKYPLSQVYPLTSLGFIFGMLSGWLIFHEQVGFMQWLGVFLIIAGCICIAKV